MQKALAAMVGAAVLAITVGCHSNDPHQSEEATTRSPAPAANDTQTQPAVPDDARQVRPLGEGDKAPAAILRRGDGRTVDLAKLYAQKPTVLIFFRGGWCPYCNTHLSRIAAVEGELLSMGYQVLAISPDRPEELAKTLNKHRMAYQLLSDSDVALARAFSLVFRVDDPTLEKYRGFGMDLEQASGRTHHMLPVPAVYIVDTQGIIRFAHWDADYKKRLEGEALLEVAARITASWPQAN